MEKRLDPERIAYVAAYAARDKKAKRITVLDLREITVIADYFVICTGNSLVQVRAIVDHVLEKLDEMGIKPHHVEGLQRGRWVLLDYESVVVHVFHRLEREFYDLERLWGDARKTILEDEDEDVIGVRSGRSGGGGLVDL
ncbi:MAG TPA: ribosome silencing factor [Clostridia bacterium]|nr:ribosome silencing factor [Clostridia bacterium]